MFFSALTPSSGASEEAVVTGNIDIHEVNAPIQNIKKEIEVIDVCSSTETSPAKAIDGCKGTDPPVALVNIKKEPTSPLGSKIEDKGNDSKEENDVLNTAFLTFVVPETDSSVNTQGSGQEEKEVKKDPLEITDEDQKMDPLQITDEDKKIDEFETPNEKSGRSLQSFSSC